MLEYNPNTGIFVWIVSRPPIRKGSVAGCVSKRGDWQIGLFGKRLKAHRLAFLYMTGKMPAMIDHKNRNKIDNRWVNLRETNKSLNAANMVRKNRLGVKGAYSYLSGGKLRYAVTIKVEYKKIYLGSFDNLKSARKAYSKASKKYFGNHARLY